MCTIDTGPMSACEDREVALVFDAFRAVYSQEDLRDCN